MTITDPYVLGYRKAAKSLLRQGICPAPFRHELQVLWSQGDRSDRELVQEISKRWETAP